MSEVKVDVKETKPETETSLVVKKEKPVKETRKKEKKQPNNNGLKVKTRETVSELRKVTWPDFPTVLKKTGVVLAFCAVSLVFLLLIDLLFKYLVGLLAL